MSAIKEAAEKTGIVQEKELSLLDKAIKATKQTSQDQSKALLKVLTESALNGTVTWNKNVLHSINKAICSIDEALSKQLREIMHTARFKKLEGSWRGLHHLVRGSETSTNLKIKVFNASKNALSKDLSRAVEFDQSQLFKKIYENEFGMPGGEPYSVLVGDYEFSNHPEDIDLLRDLSSVAASAFAPFLSAASASLLGMDSWRDLATPRDLAKIFDANEFAKWRSFREAEDSRFCVLTMPRALARLPYGKKTRTVEAFHYEEALGDNADGQLMHENYCWMNAAYALAAKMTQAFSTYGWTTAIRGAEGGGKVENLPFHTFLSDEGDVDAQCPTEIGITDRREAELSRLGFLPLCHYKNTDYAVFFGAQTAQKPKKYDRPAATANAAISSRLPYLMATSRFAHYLKVMARDKIGSFMEASDCEAWLNRWILSYVNGNPHSKQSLKAKYPLAEATISVKEIKGQPGCYHAVALLRPWLQMEALTASMRLVARIPKMGGGS
jgi:type VI secretion system protein ImpC